MSAVSHRSDLAPWILVCGGFHTRGGMDKANLALAEYLVDTGHPVYLVAHDIDPTICARDGVTPIVVPKPAGSVLLGERGLNRQAQQLAAKLKARNPATRLLANG